jgi:hypothetical protein
VVEGAEEGGGGAAALDGVVGGAAEVGEGLVRDGAVGGVERVAGAAVEVVEVREPGAQVGVREFGGEVEGIAGEIGGEAGEVVERDAVRGEESAKARGEIGEGRSHRESVARGDGAVEGDARNGRKLARGRVRADRNAREKEGMEDGAWKGPAP